MAFWLSAALLNIFGRGSRGAGAVPENRTWTAFSGASSDRSSEAAAAAPGRSRQPPGLARIPAGRRQRGRGRGDAPAPAAPGGTFPAPLDGIFGASLANVPAPWRSAGARGCTPGADRASPRPAWGPADPSPRLRARRSPLVPQLRARARRVPPAETPAPSADPAPSGSVPRPTEGAGEEAPGRSANSISQPRRETRLCSAPLHLPYPAFLFPGYLALKKKKKKNRSSLAKAFLLFPRQTAKWLGVAIPARFARCPWQPLIRSGSSLRAPPGGHGPRGSRGPSPLPGGCRSGSPRARRVWQAPAAWWGLVSVNVTPLPNHLHPSPCWLQAARCLPDGAHRGKGGGLLCPPRADAEPSWSSSSAALTPCPWMGQGRGSKQGDRHQRFLCHWRIKIWTVEIPLSTLGLETLGKDLPARDFSFSF